MSGKVSSLSVFFPAYNDALSLPSLVEKAFAVLNEVAETFEVIVINDGSRDETGVVLRRMQARFGPRLRVIEHPENRGYGAALRTGLGAARHELVFYTDGDGQYDVGELPLLLREMRSGILLVNGYKLKRHDPPYRICIGWLYNLLARSLFGVTLRDIDCDFRLMRREALRTLGLTSNTGSICVELVRGIELSGCGIAEVGVHHYPRLHGRSQFFRVRSLATTAQQLLELYWRLALLPRMRRLRLRSLSLWVRP
jgi:glycosyltransferase involved in cell wall biosynthesis